MAIFVGTGATPPPIVLQRMATSDATWIEADGTEWPLTAADVGYFMTDGVKGLDAAPITLTTVPDPRGGDQLVAARPESRYLTVPMYAWGREHMGFVESWRAVLRAFTRTSQRGPGWFRVDRPDGTARRIQAYYADGWQGSTGRGLLWDAAGVSLRCLDPYWQDVEQISAGSEYQAAGTPFLSPFPSITSSWTLSGPIDITNPGDVTAWPEWTITGPASSIVATNHTTGEAFTLTPSAMGGGDLTLGQTVTISTRPWQVRGPGSNPVWTAALNFPSAVLWGLQPGTNRVEFAVTGSAAGSSVTLAFYPRYELA
jgi:hypothetical protein